MYKQTVETMFHVFSDEIDEWTDSLKEAVRIARIWAKENGCVRIYQETNWSAEEGIFLDEDCILSHGAFPW